MAKRSTAEPTLHDLFGPDPLEEAVRGEIRETRDRAVRGDVAHLFNFLILGDAPA